VSGLADEQDPAPPEEPPAEEAPAEEPETGEPPEEDAPKPGDAPPAGEQPPMPSLDDVVTQLQAIPIGPFLLSTVSTLASIAYGKLDAGELEDARGAIDAIRALLPVLEDRIEPQTKRDFEQALANLQVAYADASAKSAS
jgi:hypothetical protein